MDLTKEQWAMIGIGTGGLLAGVFGASLFMKPKPIDTGISRLYRIEGQRKSEVAFHIKATEDGYFLEFDAPYGVSSTNSDSDAGDAQGELETVIEAGAPYSDIEVAASVADEAMAAQGYTPVDGWLDALEDDLKEEAK